MNSFYQGAQIILPTKHGKSLVIAPPFLKKLGATIVEYDIDTDILGTFSGEIERKGSALQCAKQKCEMGLINCGDQTEYGLASEGSFGPHPFIPFAACDAEILYFIDRHRGFDLHMSLLSTKTNYQMKAISSLESLQQFAESALFPSHALILRSNDTSANLELFKGISCQDELEAVFNKLLKNSRSKEVWVETDMRALFNPSRMTVIAELANQLADRLAAACPACNSPGWGKVGIEKGLPCESCNQPTELISHEIYGCVLCENTEKKTNVAGLKKASPMYCSWCNP